MILSSWDGESLRRKTQRRQLTSIDLKAGKHTWRNALSRFDPENCDFVF